VSPTPQTTRDALLGVVKHGTAEIGLDSVRVPYSGDTCLGKVSGVETLRRN